MPDVLVIANAAAEPIGMLGDWLSAAGARLRECRAWVDGELPEDLSGLAGVIVLGGPMSATDDAAAPWLPNVRALLREAVAASRPVLGICLGAQLLAVAHGGRVEPNPSGPEYGAQLVAKRPVAAGDPLFGSLPITPDVIQWHRDAITALPPGALLLASSPVCEVQAFRLGRLAWGMQFHIETTPAMVRGWAAQDAAELAGYAVDVILDRAEAVHADLAEVWQPVAAAFAAIVADPDAVPAGRAVPTSVAGPITDPAAIRAALAAEAGAARGLLPQPSLRPQAGPPRAGPPADGR
jgi:GMP synthase-like glutamine amidotransferase